jgi:hypothetical protein
MLILIAAPSTAQQAGGTPVSLGADVGLFSPFENRARSSFTGRVTADLYPWGALGTRFAAGFANLDLADGLFEHHVDTAYLTGGLIHSFREGKLHLYAHVGVGVYRLSGDRSGTQIALTCCSGVAVLLPLRHLLLTPEITAHLVSRDAPRFSLAPTVGLHTRPD